MDEKGENTLFDVTKESHDGEFEVCEFVGIYLLVFTYIIKHHRQGKYQFISRGRVVCY